jgi:hypothetical protein
LRSAHIFSFGGVGEAAVVTSEEKAYGALSHSPDFAQQMRKLLSDATTLEGRMYALYGLHQLRSSDYPALRKPYRANHTPVSTAFGCIVIHQPASELISGYIDHAHPK